MQQAIASPLQVVYTKGTIPTPTALEVPVFTPKIIAHQAIHLAQRKIMIEKYRQYVQDYAEACPELNKQVIKYNSKVYAYRHQNDKATLAEQETAKLKHLLGKCSIAQYNQAAEAKNTQLNEPLILLKEYKSVKKSTEHVFSLILFKYAMQIDEKNKILQSCGATTTRAIQKLEVNHFELANTVINEVSVLPYSKRTIHNHINRMVEAGILFDYEFKGREKPVRYHVNNQILTIYCMENKKSLSLENQLFNFKLGKNFHNKIIDTRTYRNNIEIIEPVKKQVRENETHTLSNILSKMPQINQNTPKRKQIEPQDAENNQNTPKREETAPQDERHTTPRANMAMTNTSFLENAIIDTRLLVEKFVSGGYKNWRFYEKAAKDKPFSFVTMEHLEYEESFGFMGREDYLELLQQILLKMCAPIYKKSHKNGLFNSSGATYNGLKELKTLLLNNNGSCPTKKVAITRFKGLMWRLKFAANYFNSAKVTQNPLFISSYLDPTRTTKKEGGFAYTLSIYKSHLEAESHKQAVDKSKKQFKAKIRKQKMKAIELVEKKVNSLKNGKISIVELHDYVSNNAHIPQEIKTKLPQYIQKAYAC